MSARAWVEGGFVLLGFALADRVLWAHRAEPPWFVLLCTGVAWLVLGCLLAGVDALRRRYAVRIERRQP